MHNVRFVLSEKFEYAKMGNQKQRNRNRKRSKGQTTIYKQSMALVIIKILDSTQGHRKT